MNIPLYVPDELDRLHEWIPIERAIKFLEERGFEMREHSITGSPVIVPHFNGEPCQGLLATLDQSADLKFCYTPESFKYHLVSSLFGSELRSHLARHIIDFLLSGVQPRQ